MRKHQRAAAYAALGFVPIALIAVLASSAPAEATGDCRTISVSNPRDVTASGGGEATLTRAGVIMSTPEQASKVSYRHQLGTPVPFTAIRHLSYTTDRQDSATGNDQVVAAYKLGVDINSDNTVDGVLVYEPLYSGTVTADRQRHDPLAGKWWYSAEPENRQSLATFEQWTKGEGPVRFPAPEVRWFGVEQGTWNAGAVTLVNDIKFAGDRVCKRVTFCPPPTTPPATTPPATTPPATTPPTVTPPATTPPATTAPTTTPPATPPTTATPPDNPGGGGGEQDTPPGDTLPVTGTPVATYAAGGGAALLMFGVVVLVAMRRRSTRYEA